MSKAGVPYSKPNTNPVYTFMADISNTTLVPKSFEDLEHILQNDTKIKVAGRSQPSI